MSSHASFSTDTNYFSSGYAPPAAQRPSTPMGATWTSDVRQWAHQVVEKVRTATVGGRIRFLPWYDPYTEETPEIRSEYRKMLIESSVKAAFQTKILSVISLDVQCQSPDDDDPRQVQAAQFCSYAFRKVRGGMRRVGWSVLHPALVDGHSVCEKVWNPDPEPSGPWRGKRIFHAVKAKDTRYLQLGIDPYRNVTAIRGMGFNAGRVWSPSDFIIFSYMELFENPSGTSDFRAAYRPYWIKNTTWQLRSLHLDKFTGPYLKGTYATQDQKDALETALQDARATTWLTVPVGSVVDAIDLSMRGTADFDQAIKDCDREILIAIVGAHLHILEGQTSGGRGDTKIHKKTSDLVPWFLAASLADIYREQLATPLVEENFHGVEVPDVSVGALTEEAMLERLKVDDGLQKLGLKLSQRDTYKSYSRPVPEPDDVLQAPSPQPQPTPGGDAAGASPFSERVRQFCMEGENRGLPGPCPESKTGHGLPDDKALASAKIEPLKKADAVHGAGGLAKVTVGDQSYFFKAAPASEVKREAAVSDLAQLAGVGVPQARPANVASKEGLLSGWAEGKNGDEDKAGFYAAVAKDPASAAKLVAFHFLVGAEDRHKGNIVVGPDGSLTSLDHSDALAPDRSLADAAEMLGQDDLMAGLEKAQGGGDVRLDAGAVGAVAAKTGEMAGLLRARGMESEAKGLEARGKVLTALAREQSPTEGRLKALAGAS